MKPPTSQVLVNYYHDVWLISSHTLVSLTKIVSSKVKFKWNKIEQDDSDEIKRILAHDILLAY